MIRRTFWLAMGATMGALIVRKLTQLTQRATPAGISQTLSESARGLADSIRGFVDDARAGAREREIELKESTGLDSGTQQEHRS